MARKGNQQKNGLDGNGTTSNQKKGLQSGSAMPNKKGKGNINNLKDSKKEELPNDTPPNTSVTDSLHKKKSNKSGRQTKVENQPTAGTSTLEHSEPRDGTSEDRTADMSATGTSCLEEEKHASDNFIHKSKNRKSNTAHSINGFDEDGLPETIELPEALGVKYLKTFMLSVSKASSEWLERHKPLFDVLVTKILISREYVRVKVKYAYPIVMKWLTHFFNILLLVSMVWLDCMLRGIDSVVRMGTTSFFTVIWCSIFSVVAMIGMLKFVTVGAIVALVAVFVGFTIGLLLLAVSGIVFLWLYGSFWTTLLVLLFGGTAFMLSHERLALLIMTLYSVYSAWTLVGWVGIILALNLSFFSSDALIFFLRNNMSEQRRSNTNTVPEQTAFSGEEPRDGGTGTGTHPTGDRSPGVASTSGSDDLTSEDEVVRLLNSVDHYSAFGLSKFQEIDASLLKREYRKKAMLVHPDKNMGNEKAAEAFKKLQNGYEVLLDTSKRKTYDDELRREDLLNYFRRFQNASPKNKRNGNGLFGRTEVHVDDPMGESRRIACQKCTSFHMWFYTNKTKSRARSCQECKDSHPAKDGDGWVEQSSQPLLFGMFQKVDSPRAYVCADSKIYDATEWYICQGMRCPVNTHKPSFHVNTSVMSKHSNSSKGGSSSRNGNGNGNGMPNMEESMTEEEFMEWLQNAMQSGMFDNFAGGSDVPSSNTTSTKSNGTGSNKRETGKSNGESSFIGKDGKVYHSHDGLAPHSHEPIYSPGFFSRRAPPLVTRDFKERAFTIGIGGPVGTGKTALMLALCRFLRDKYSLAAVTNDIFTKEDGEFLVKNGALPEERIRAVETGGCPHAAIREDISINLGPLEELSNLYKADILLCESGGDNLAANFSRELADYIIYIIDVSGGDKIPRKGGPGITQADLLVINKTDLAQAVGADLGVMERDALKMRDGGPFVFAQVKHGVGVEEIVHNILQGWEAATGTKRR